MRKFIALLLVFSVIAGSVHLDEWVKFPDLTRHFTEHKLKGEPSNFMLFVYNHYILQPLVHANQDQDSHSKLPFKSTKSVHQHFAFSILVSTVAFLTFRTSVVLKSPVTGAKNVDGFSFVWQPPKIG